MGKYPEVLFGVRKKIKHMGVGTKDFMLNFLGPSPTNGCSEPLRSAGRAREEQLKLK